MYTVRLNACEILSNLGWAVNDFEKNAKINLKFSQAPYQLSYTDKSLLNNNLETRKVFDTGFTNYKKTYQVKL